MSDDFSKFTAPKPNEEIHQGAEVPVTFSIDPVDRLPVPAPAASDDRPPPLAVDTFVCMEDKRSFVIRNSDGSIWLSFEPKAVKRLPDGRYFVDGEAAEALRDSFTARPRAATYSDSLVGLRRGRELSYVAIVEPIRPACAYYARVQTDISVDRARRWLSRSCMAQRSETGEYYSVGDAAIFACTLRSPRHLESERVMDEVDESEMQKTLDRIKASAFDVDEALAEEDLSGSLGVLGSNPKG